MTPAGIRAAINDFERVRAYVGEIETLGMDGPKLFVWVKDLGDKDQTAGWALRSATVVDDCLRGEFDERVVVDSQALIIPTVVYIELESVAALSFGAISPQSGGEA